MTGDDDRRVALVTGAARGIGAAVVRRMVARGCDVYALDACLGDAGGTPYSQATREDLAAVQAEAPESVHEVVADVRDPGQVRQAVETILARHGRLDTVVAAAAVIEGGDALWDTEPDLPERLWQTDVMGIWHVAHATVPHLLSSEGPSSFVAISSAAGDVGLWHLAAYSIVKHAVVGLVRGLAADLAGTKVSVSGVAPGSTDTPMLAATARLYGLPDSKPLVEHSRIGRALRPEEIADVVDFAAFTGPAVHGSVLSADAGFVA